MTPPVLPRVPALLNDGDDVGCAALFPTSCQRYYRIKESSFYFSGSSSPGQIQGVSLLDRRVVSLTWNVTPCNATRSGFCKFYYFEEGEEVTADGAKLLGQTRLPLSRMSLTATRNLTDCSTDALHLCTNYAK